MSNQTMERIIDNYGLAFFSFYFVFPFIAKDFDDPSLPLGTIAVLLIIYFRVQHEIYSHFDCKRNLFRNSLIMVLGLTALYTLEVLHFEDLHGYHLMSYFILSITYLPSALQAERCRKMITGEPA